MDSLDDKTGPEAGHGDDADVSTNPHAVVQVSETPAADAEEEGGVDEGADPEEANESAGDSSNPHAVIPISVDFTTTAEKLQKLFSKRVTATATNDAAVSANLAALSSFGGVGKLAEVLLTDSAGGLPKDKKNGGGNYKERRRRFGANRLSFPTNKPLWMIVIESFNDTAILTLLVLAFMAFIFRRAEGWHVPLRGFGPKDS